MELLVTAGALFALVFFLPTAVTGCSLPCPRKDEQVCAHSPTQGYKTFPDKCAVDQLNHCGGQDWTVIHPGACTPPELAGCLPVCQPVCGYRPPKKFRSFINRCYLEVESQYSDYSYVHDGVCTPFEVPPTSCPKICPSIYAPVCGYSPFSGYKTFSGLCFLSAENECDYGNYIVKHEGVCTKKELESNCNNLVCTLEYNPVCGLSKEKGYKTFDNLCKLYHERGCPKFGSDYKLVHPGACTTQEIASFCKQGFCSEVGEPVCASNLPWYYTLPNICLFNQENSCKFGELLLVHPGPCTEEEKEKSCKAKCTKGRKDKVCGFSAARGYKTFPNRCQVDYENACYGSDYATVHAGKCKISELGMICEREFCQKYKGQKVCGVSPSKGYKTFNNQCNMYSENTCQCQNYELAHFGECTRKELGLFCLAEFCLKPGTPVCGLSKKKGYFTFPNMCALNKEDICKDGDFILKHEGKCTDDELGNKCPRPCYLVVDNVCGLSPTFGYRTFTNKCFLDLENSCHSGDYETAHKKTCTEDELAKNCELECDEYVYNPVCAYSPTKGYQQFDNEDFLRLNISCGKTDYKLKHKGVCKPNEVPTTPTTPAPPSPECSPNGPVCTKEYFPVCGYSQTNQVFMTFSNPCLFKAANKCTYDNDLVLAHEGVCTKDELDNNCKRKCPIAKDGALACGVNSAGEYKTFINTCTLILAHSCFRSDYTFAHRGECTKQELPLCARPELACPRILVPPVCAFSPSKNAYENVASQCFLNFENRCKGTDYIFIHDRKCTDSELGNDCSRVCPDFFKPTCGYSPTRGYKTFQNPCVFARDLACLGCDFAFVNEGRCKYPEGPIPNCPMKCSPKDQKPVCAISMSTKKYKTFINKCFVTAANKCKYGDYAIVHDGKCTKDETASNCNRKCPKLFQPVCGIDVINGYRTFPTLCDLQVANKCDGADYSLKHKGMCTQKELNGTCNFSCPLYYEGICGVSDLKGFKTFPSECFLQRENACNLSRYKKAHDGKCTPGEVGNTCNHVCQMIYSPICSKNGKHYKTHSNFCGMDRDNSCFHQDYVVMHEGECFPWELCENCKTE